MNQWYFYFVSDSSEVINLLFFSLGFFSIFQISVILTIVLDRMFGLLIKNDMMEFIFGNVAGFWIFSRFSRISSKSSDFNCFNHISWQNVLFISQKWYDEIHFQKFVRFLDFFPDFLKIFWFQWVKSIFLTEYLMYVFKNYFPDFFWRNFCCNNQIGLFYFPKLSGFCFSEFSIFTFQ